MGEGIKKSIVMGALCSPVGLAIGLFITISATGSGYEIFFIYSTLAAFISSAFFWRIIVVKKDRYRVKPGILAGALSGAVSHYTCWYIVILSRNICYYLTGSCTGSMGEPPIDPLNGLWGALGFTFWSLLFFGWITVSMGAIIGGILAPRQSTE